MPKSVERALKILSAIVVVIAFATAIQEKRFNDRTPLISIANYGPSSYLNETIDGIKEEMTKLGYIEGENIRYKIEDGDFQPFLVSQIVNTLRIHGPTVYVALTTQVALTAQDRVRRVPIIFANVSDPQEVGLVGHDNITGISDRPDIV